MQHIFLNKGSSNSNTQKPQCNKQISRKYFIFPKYILLLLLLINYISCKDLQGQSFDTLQKKYDVQENPLKELKADIDALIDNPDFSNAVIGVSVFSLETGEYFYRRNERNNLIPASTQKLLTTAAALEYLGEDFTYSTSLYLDGELQSNGEFLGNVIIRATGDPTLSKLYGMDPAEILDKWADVFDSLGINSIKGNIIGDDRYFDNVAYGPGWSWDDMSYAFSAQVSAMNIYGNVVEILFQPGEKIGDFAKYKLYPENNYLRVINNIKTVAGNIPTEIKINKDLNSNLAEISGYISLDSSNKEDIRISVSVHNPTIYYLTLFHKALLDKGIRCRTALIDIEAWNETINYSHLNPVIEHISPMLSEIITVVNKFSHNLTADVLLKTIGKEISGFGTFESGASLVSSFASKVGLPPENFVYADGSGLSRFNLISPAYQTSLLNYIYRAKYQETFMKSLARPGEKGTLKSRMTRSLAEKSVLAKTGSMNNISTICGFIKTRNGEMLAFSIMLNNFTAPQSLAHNLQDLIAMRLASFSRKTKQQGK